MTVEMRPVVSHDQMRVHKAHATHAAITKSLTYHRGWCWWTVSDASCGACVVLDELAFDASIVYDLAVAEASIERLRRSVAWA